MTRKERTQKQIIARWEALVREIRYSTNIDEHETKEAQYKRMQQLEANPEAWFKYYFPHFAYAQPADFHIAATERVLHNMEWCEVRLWSRELAKSTRTMMEVLYLALVGHAVNEGGVMQRHRKRYVMLVSNSLDNAIRLLMPYKANLEYNSRIIQDYGKQQNVGTWQMGEFITQDGVAFRAVGAGQSPRGARNEEVRPDVLLFDDVDTDADCLNKEIVAKRWRWIEEAAIGTRSVSEPTTIIFCGNRIAADCSIERATNIADHVEEVNIRDKQGVSTWPQKNKEVDIDRVLSQKSYAAQQKEYFNNPLTEGAVFKQMAYKPARELKEYKMLLCYTDPSYKETNDYKATVLVGLWEQEFHIIRCYVEQATTAQMIQWHYNIMAMVKDVSCYYYMEEVFMQDVIRKELSSVSGKAGRHIPIMGDKRKKADKFTRIECLLEPLHRNGQLYLNAKEQDNPNMKRLEEQFTAFGPGSRTHDDGPDAVEGAIWLIQDKFSLHGSSGFHLFAREENGKRF